MQNHLLRFGSSQGEDVHHRHQQRDKNLSVNAGDRYPSRNRYVLILVLLILLDMLMEYGWWQPCLFWYTADFDAQEATNHLMLDCRLSSNCAGGIAAYGKAPYAEYTKLDP